MDHHFAEKERYERQGFPEAIYSPGKSVEQIIDISKELVKGKGPAIVTRAEKEIYFKLKKKFPSAKYFPLAKIILLNNAVKNIDKQKYICVVTAGTTDISVAEESAVTAEILGNRVERLYDVGVAGVHRVLKFKEKLLHASCIVVCAGMEGALPSVIGGLVKCPVIGVPTSVGYGVSFKGVSALLSMLNSCAPNVCVVNIDDGFGAGIISGLINKGVNKI
ncbi:MAG: nickel pincer cofactor biosynthesis protein LarB [Elusimicrobia bacterium]|nr:nickel pincer cofactor biosynthesis protein LarB [Elusimicrobiota bacterium]